MDLQAYLPVLVQILLAVVMALGIIVASHLFGQRAATSKIKDSAYECGLPAEGSQEARFSVKFYVTAMLFILFDIEVVFLIPGVLVYRDFLSQNLSIFWPVMVFVLLVVAGLGYELRKGALEWEK
ncbi:MAG: NADH-quinone oxidoreductase subunit A [Puniceicoccaceae bacterium 5H]|nr:MAG: NADH-quinone oxidoreductase subunit A [Puniceicoccaceae bacterium 5H]